MSVWRERPHRAKFRQGELFDKSYSDIFTADLTATQVVLAVLLFRISENKRKRPPAGAPELVRYGSNFIAMLMGRYLLADLALGLNALDHRKFEKAREAIDANAEQYFERAVKELEAALVRLYGEQKLSAQRLAATFRRGDLLPDLRAL